MNTFLFIVMPYVAIVVFLIGSISRYWSRGFHVSSLSSQFLEGKQLFYGSIPFHWGLFLLFFGHLLAFAIPRAVVLWNGHPVRLLILEVTAFTFGLMVLLGLLLLIFRRMYDRRVQKVTTKMDIIVYVLLLVQVISGLWIAYFNRWGSNWFAAFVTPYLRSIFTFNPDISAISSVNSLSLKIHVVNFFVFVSFIPFTRFMHFLVIPLQYIVRSYQVVIWNWDRKRIRVSRNHAEGKPAQNH